MRQLILFLIRKLTENRILNFGKKQCKSRRLDLNDYTPVATIQSNKSVQHIYPTDQVRHNSVEIPEQLIMEPGFYSIFGFVYDCSAPGVYRFTVFPELNIQRVVVDKDCAIKTASYISLLVCRGNTDDKRDIKDSIIEARVRLLSMTCGYQCLFAKKLLEDVGFKARTVYTYTLEELNGFNDGHVLLEVWSAEQQGYVAMDLDKKCIFKHVDKWLNGYELTKKIYSNQPVEMSYYSDLPLVDWSAFDDCAHKFNYQFFELSVYATASGRDLCIRRICQYPSMRVDGIRFDCYWDQNASRILKARHKNRHVLLDENSFKERFYQ